jgi:hypothetical protein
VVFERDVVVMAIDRFLRDFERLGDVVAQVAHDFGHHQLAVEQA